MTLPLAGCARFFAHVAPRLFLVRLILERGREIAFAVLAAVDDRFDMVAIPMVAGENFAAGEVAFSFIAPEDAILDARRRRRVRRLADPFRHAARVECDRGDGGNGHSALNLSSMALAAAS